MGMGGHTHQAATGASAWAGGEGVGPRADGPATLHFPLPMSSIVTNNYRYKRPPRKRKAVALNLLPTIIAPETKAKLRAHPETSPATDEHEQAIVIVRKPGRIGAVPDMTPEEHRQRGDAADALFRELSRCAAGRSK